MNIVHNLGVMQGEFQTHALGEVFMSQLSTKHMIPQGRGLIEACVMSPDKSHSSAGVVLVSEDPGANDGTIWRHQPLQLLDRRERGRERGERGGERERGEGERGKQQRERERGETVVSALSTYPTQTTDWRGGQRTKPLQRDEGDCGRVARDTEGGEKEGRRALR